MGKSSSQSKRELETLEKLENLEDKIKNFNTIQKRLKFISLSGVLLTCVLMATFIYRLYDYFVHYDYKKVMDQVSVEAKAVVQPEIDMFLAELRTDLLPVFFDHLIVGFKESTPEFRESTLKLADNLGREIRVRAEERFLVSLISSIEKSGEEIEEIFPDFSSEELEKQIGKSIDFYMETLHDSLEERIALASSSLIDLKNTAEALGQSTSSDSYPPQSSSEAEEQLLEALLDLVVYQIKPEMGIELAED